jgi:selenide, water dikinase
VALVRRDWWNYIGAKNVDDYYLGQKNEICCCCGCGNLFTRRRLAHIISMRNLILIGGGHSHAIVLRLLGLQPLPNVRLILISDVTHAPYSGMLPGHLGGFYNFADCHIDLRALAQFAQAEFVLDAAIGLDLQNNQVLCRQHKPLDFDWLSIDIGSTPTATDILGVQEYAIAAKPVPQFLAAWQQFVQQKFDRSISIGIVGGGAGGVELALTLQVQLQRLCPAGATIHLFHRRSELMNSYDHVVRCRFKQVLIDRGIKLHLNEAVESIEQIEDTLKLVRCRSPQVSGLSISCDLVIWVTQAAAPLWVRQSGLSTDEQGFILIKDTLQSLSHPHIFATGDIATMKIHPRPKAGVFAVRQGQPLFANLQRITTGQSLQSFLPQQRYLSLIGLGNQQAIATWGNFCTRPSRLLWWWKDHIDRRFMSQFPRR